MKRNERFIYSTDWRQADLKKMNNAFPTDANTLATGQLSLALTALTNEQSLIAAEIACYRAFSDAAFTRDSRVKPLLLLTP